MSKAQASGWVTCSEAGSTCEARVQRLHEAFAAYPAIRHLHLHIPQVVRRLLSDGVGDLTASLRPGASPMAEDKDYFGEKLRLAERAREDAYCRQRDQALIEQMRQKDRDATAAAAPAPVMFTSILVPVD